MSKRSNRRVIRNAPVVHVSVGDRVRVVFSHRSGPSERDQTGRVVKIKRRYGHHGNFVRTSPLLEVKFDGAGKHFPYLDQSFVVEVLERHRGAQRLPENMFREALHSSVGYWRPLKRGIWTGTLVGLVHHVLGNYHARITHPIDEDKLLKLFTKTKLNRARTEYGFVEVKADAFKRWVKQNYPKLLATTAELDADQTRENRETSAMLDEMDEPINASAE